MTIDQYDVFGVYISFLLALISNFIPSTMIQFFGGFLFIVTFFSAYIIRWKNKNESFKKNHMTFLIRTFWIGSLILVIGMLLSILLGDHTIINNTVEGIMNGIVFTYSELTVIMMNYARANIFVFGLCLLPSLIYLSYRLIKGMIKTYYHQEIEHLKSWF